MHLLIRLGALTAGGLTLYAFLRYKFCKSKNATFNNQVTRSSAMMAAARAWESARQDKLFYDPLAKALAGEVYEAVLKYFRNPTYNSDEVPRVIPNLTARSKTFDDVIMHIADGQCSSPISGALQIGHVPVVQVVLLGAGLDARAWRLDLNPGVRWLEVDSADVITFKRQKLAEIGAATESQLLSDDATKRRCSFALKVGSWDTVVADVQEPGWSNALVATGLDPSQPTLWVLEGLMYYLRPESVEPFLHEMASISGEGSWLLFDTFQQGFLSHIRAKKPEGVKKSKGPMSDYWLFETPTDIPTYYASHGWPVQTSLTYSEAAQMYNCRIAEPPEDPQKEVCIVVSQLQKSN